MHGRIVVIGPLPPPAGGMATQSEQLVRRWREAGGAAELLPVNPPYRPAWVGQIRGLRAVFRLPPYLLALWRAAREASVFHIMANSGWSWFLFATPAILIGRLRGVGLVVNYRGGRAERFLLRWRWLVIPLLRRAHALVVPSEFLKRVFEARGLHVRVVPNGVDGERFPFRAPTPATPLAPHVVVTRHLEAIYDVATAVRAFALLRRYFPRARLSIAGDGPERAALQALVGELNLSRAVRFTGTLDRDGMAALLTEADVLLNTSRVDNMPNALLEALAAGVPVASTSAGGIPDVVDHERTALLFPPDDPEAAAAAIRRLLDERALAVALATAGRGLADTYGVAAVHRQWAGVYTEVGR